MLNGIRRWLLQESGEPRRTARSPRPEVIVHYWAGSATGGREVRDISEAGAYIVTDEHWYPGTIIRVIVESQRMTVPERTAARIPVASICLTSRVVRQGPDGVAVEFVYSGGAERKAFRKFLAEITVTQAGTASAAATSRSGQALVEFALILPLVFLLAVNALNFGGFLIAWIGVAGAARDAADYMVVSSASPGKPTAATTTQVTSLITADLHSLPNSSSVVVATCSNSTAAANGCTTFSDPEAPSYTLSTVDVTYTYNPFIPLFSFAKMGISATLPSATIHRKVVMRMLQ